MDSPSIKDLVGGLKDITMPIDWAEFPPEGLVAAARAKAAVQRIFADSSTSEIGYAMRGIGQALAEAYEPHYLERGMASVQRGIRNAFAEVHHNIFKT